MGVQITLANLEFLTCSNTHKKGGGGVIGSIYRRNIQLQWFSYNSYGMFSFWNLLTEFSTFWYSQISKLSGKLIFWKVALEKMFTWMLFLVPCIIRDFFVILCFIYICKFYKFLGFLFEYIFGYLSVDIYSLSFILCIYEALNHYG